jgi:hypothetical protein
MSLEQDLIKFNELSSKFRTERTSLSERPFELSSSDVVKPNTLVEGLNYRIWERQVKASRTLSEMVFGDEMAGKVYPGSFLWARSLAQDGRLDMSFPLKRDAPLVVTLSDATTADGAPRSFEFDGSFSAFEEILQKFVRSITKPQAKFSESLSEIEDSKTSMLQIGIAASGWGAKVAADFEKSKTKNATSMLFEFSQAYFTVSCAPLPGKALFSSEVLNMNPDALGTFLPQYERNGELGVVRRVTYGRRVLMSVTSNYSVDKLKAAIKASYDGKAFEASGSLDAEKAKILSESEATVVVVGGKTDSEIMGISNLPTPEKLRRVLQYVSKTADVDTMTSAAVTAFEVVYALDSVGVLKAESTSFSQNFRQLTGNSQTISGSLQSLAWEPARKDAGDEEMYSDDITHVQIDCEVVLKNDGVFMGITYKAIEGNKNGSEGDTKFRKVLLPTNIFPFTEDRKVISIEGQPARYFKSIRMQLKGKNHGPVGIPDLPADFVLKNIEVSFDAPGRNDLSQMDIQGNYEVRVGLADGKPEITETTH